MVNRLRKRLTAKQKKVLRALEAFILEHGYAPSIRQLGELVGIPSPSAVYKHILSLERKGYLKRTRGKLRLEGLPTAAEPLARVPMAGLVPAGAPREVFEASGEAVDVPDWMVGRRRGNVFCISVEGKSMVDAYIDDGDRVLVERTNTASSGEMVVALLDDGTVTLKRLRVENGGVWLVPENPEFSPIRVKELRILGRVVGVLRKY
ncbi:MAG: transcriptional repressor LexA [Candidatus Aminicenantales bacterium]